MAGQTIQRSQDCRKHIIKTIPDGKFCGKIERENFTL
jgi:hypothetical protein